jgi:hypothetical protein
MSFTTKAVLFGFADAVAVLVVPDSPDAPPSISGLPVQKPTKLE